MLPDILNYVPDPNNGRPLVGAKVYFLIGGYDAPDRDSDLDITKIAPITANGDVVPQPLYTSKGGTIRVGSQVDQPPLVPSGLTQKVAVYDKCGKLAYQVEYSAQGPFVSSTALAAVDSSVLIGGITAESLVALAQGGGGGSGNGIDYVTTMPAPGESGTTLFQQNNYDLGFTVDDGDSIQIVQFSMLGSSAYTAGGGSGATYTFANSSGSGNTLLKAISPTSYEWKRIIAGANVTITDDGNALTINSSGGGGGGTTTTLSNAGTTGLGLVLPVSGADYPIKRIQAGTNVTITDNGTYYTIAATSGGGGGGITSLQNVNDAVGAGIYKETTAGVGYFRRVQSSDGSLSVLSDVDDVDFSVTSVGFDKISAVPTARLLGRSTTGTGIAEAISIGSNLTLSGGVLSASGGGVTDGDKGDIVVSASGATWSFDSAVVSTFARTFLDDTSAAAVRTTISAQQLDATLTAIAGVATAANQLMYSTGVDAFAMTNLTSLARTLLGNSTVNTMLNTLGIIVITNANGTCIKFPTAAAASGIQICFQTGLSTGSIATASGSIFVGSAQQWDFPVAFASAPAVIPAAASNSAAWIGGGMSANNTLSAFFRGYSGVSGTTATVCLIAVGTY